ncbi:translation initiation factor EIF-2B subunit related [Plasmodium gallinaceum]|uniref:Translation initiation factor EIF-2B subunit related n=1 Tax=Plasmodium gallinaceum TaxID=5849 RepID=A0A1J1GR96_PLAGA|nr:translation initiation factor EIF-2B subunit related [Plasmodium gallinaceum]CRG94945.1 translation initiation factor EIF-2B subunit related [Plasmodium gallinaceum]
MVNYDDITQTLLIERIKIQYDSNSQWNKYLKYSLRNPHCFIYPDISHFNNCNIIKMKFNKDFDYFNSTFLSKGYKIKNIDKLNKDYNEDNSERYLFEIEKYDEKNFSEDNDALIRKVVYLFKECMYYFMSFNENDGQILEKCKNSNKKDIKHSSEYELFKSLNDCIIQLHDSKKKKNQALIMTNEFCGIFTPKYVKLTKYSEQFKNLLKENNINFSDMFNEEIKNNEFYKKKKQHFDNLKNSEFIPLTKGEISLASKNSIIKNNLMTKKKNEENNNSENEEVNKVILNGQVDLKGGKYEKEETSDKIKRQNENDLNVKKKEKKKEKEKKKRKKNEHSENKKNCSTNLNISIKENNNIIKDKSDCSNKEEDDNNIKKKRHRKNDEKKKIKNEINRNEETKENICKEIKGLDMILYENEEICNYLNIKNENIDVNKNEDFTKNTKIFNLLNKNMNSDDYIYKEIKDDFMKEINLPNNFNYDINVIEIYEKDIKNFYKCVVKYINKKREKLKIYYIISNFLFFFSKMYKNYINFDDNIHKDINRNFDYKTIIIQGNILPYNFFILLKALHLMSLYDVIKNFFITVSYDERKNKCLHFLNLTENRFYENFKKFEKNIKTNFVYIYKFLQNMIPVNKYLITQGKLYRHMENIPFSFENNDFLQITYNKSYDNKDIVLYDENNEEFTDENHTLGKNLNNISNNNALRNYNYIIYDSNNIHKKLHNIKNYYKIIDDKEMHKLMKDLTDFNDNYAKNLLKENKILFLLDLYEKNLVFPNILFNSIFFDSYISLIYINYINNFTKNIENFKHIPLFKPSYVNLLVQHIIKKKNEKKLKKTKARNVHTVDKLCNNFFKNSFNKILNAKIKEGIDNTSLNNLKKEKINKEKETKEEDDQNNDKNKLNNNNEYDENAIKTDHVKTNENKIECEQNNENNLQVTENNLIINEAVIKKKDYDNLIICIFVFINENSHTFNEEEKEIRELILYVLKSKENLIENNKIKYVFKYRNNINDVITLSEIEIRRNDYCQIYIIGLVLNNNISNKNLQTDLNNLYNLNQTLHQKYDTISFDIKTKVFTFYWIYEVHIYGSIFLKNKEIKHMIKKVDNTYQLPYNVQWKNKLLWGYYLYIIQDSVNSNYTDEIIEKLNEEGINIKLCNEEFDAKIVENDINEILDLHNLEFNDLKCMENNIFMNIIFLIENGHLTYFTFINTDNVYINQRNNYISIQIFKSKITFPSFNLNTPLLNDSWLKDVLSKQTLLPFKDYYYKF